MFYSSSISDSVNAAKNISILYWSLFKNGHKEHKEALFEGQAVSDGEQSKTVGALPSTADITVSIFISFGSFMRTKPPFTPLYDFKMPDFAKDCKIFARKLLDIESSLESVSLSIGKSVLDRTMRDKIAYSLARVINIL